MKCEINLLKGSSFRHDLTKINEKKFFLIDIHPRVFVLLVFTRCMIVILTNT